MQIFASGTDTPDVNLFASLSEAKVQKGTVVSSHHPRTVSGLYWGYSVRLASCLSKYLQGFSTLPGLPHQLFQVYWLHICSIHEHLFLRNLLSQRQLIRAASSHAANLRAKARGVDHPSHPPVLCPVLPLTIAPNVYVVAGDRSWCSPSPASASPFPW